MLPGEADPAVQLDHVPRAHEESIGGKALGGMDGKRRLIRTFVRRAGRPVDGGARLLDGAVDGMRNNLRIVPAPTVRLSALGADSPLLGALALASGDFDA